MLKQGRQRAERAEPRANFSERAEPMVGSARLLGEILHEPSHRERASLDGSARLGSAGLRSAQLVARLVARRFSMKNLGVQAN